MFIFDWNKNSEEILEQGHYNTKRSVNAEQIHLCRYWQEKEFDKEEAYKIWVSLESPQAVGCFEEAERREYFESFWTKAMEEGPNEKYAYGLTCKEFALINGLDVDLEYKNFLKTLVEYCRTYGRNGVFYCKLSIWSALAKQQRHHLTEAREIKMADWNRKYNLYTTTVSYGYTKKSSNCRVEINFFDQDGEIENKINFCEPWFYCSNCGQIVTRHIKTQRTLCEDCYKALCSQRSNQKYIKKKDINT